MPFGLVIGTPRASELQDSIQNELTKRGYSADPDPVMAEYITIMIINNKTAQQITVELQDLIGPEFASDNGFTDWLFLEASKSTSSPAPESTSPAVAPEPVRETAPDAARRPTSRAPLYQQALSQVLPSTSPGALKRSASARSPSPSGQGPAKSRRTDLPTGPRAMGREGAPRSLLDRVGARNSANYQQEDVQSHIDSITSMPEQQHQNMMMGGGFPGMNGMDMNAMAAGMSNPLMLQEMMMSQMAMMAQMANNMGMMNPTGQFANGGAPQGFNEGYQPHQNGFQQNGMSQRGRGGGRGGRGRGGGHVDNGHELPIAAPIPQLPTVSPAQAAAAATRSGFVLPERPASPTLCKFVLKCTNAHCRYSHPSPVATSESGVVLSNEPCENGKQCQNQDCIKGHVSPAVLQPDADKQPPPKVAPTRVPAAPTATAVPCRFGTACTRPGCTFSHPPAARQNHAVTTQCRFGTACTRAACVYQHPPGRTLPGSFHRGLEKSAPLVNISAPETGTMGGPSHHKSVKFNNSGVSIKEKLAQQMKEIEEKKGAAELQLREAETKNAVTAV